jgi:Rrf2 family protein
MLAISKETDYALKLLLFLATHRGSWSLEEITEHEHLPYKYLSRLVLDLKKAGLVHSRQGRTGGYTLAKRSTQITLSDVLELFEREKGVVSCLVKGKKCLNESNCPQKPAYDRLEEKLLKEASKIRLKDLQPPPKTKKLITS